GGVLHPLRFVRPVEGQSMTPVECRVGLVRTHVHEVLSATRSEVSREMSCRTVINIVTPGVSNHHRHTPGKTTRQLCGQPVILGIHNRRKPRDVACNIQRSENRIARRHLLSGRSELCQCECYSIEL